jgi:MFS family permease
VLILGMVAALFTAAMMSQNVLTAPFSDKILKAGAVGFGYCNAGWSLGAIFVSILAGTLLRHSSGHLWVLSVSLILSGVACVVLPHYAVLAIGVAGYIVMGSGRGMAGVGINSALMHEVPRQLMGRTQNVINFTAIAMQLVLTMAVGWLGQHIGLATGFYAVASFYLAGGLLAVAVARMPASGAKLEPLPVREILMPQVEAAEL